MTSLPSLALLLAVLLSSLRQSWAYYVICYYKSQYDCASSSLSCVSSFALSKQCYFCSGGSYSYYYCSSSLSGAMIGIIVGIIFVSVITCIFVAYCCKICCFRRYASPQAVAVSYNTFPQAVNQPVQQGVVVSYPPGYTQSGVVVQGQPVYDSQYAQANQSMYPPVQQGYPPQGYTQDGQQGYVQQGQPVYPQQPPSYNY